MFCQYLNKITMDLHSVKNHPTTSLYLTYHNSPQFYLHFWESQHVSIHFPIVHCPISKLPDCFIPLRTPSTWAWHWSSSYLFSMLIYMFYRLISLWAGSLQYSDPISPIDISQPCGWSQMPGTSDCLFCTRNHLQLLARRCLLHWWHSHHLWCHHSGSPEFFGQVYKNDVEVDWRLWKTIYLWFWRPVHKTNYKLIRK